MAERPPGTPRPDPGPSAPGGGVEPASYAPTSVAGGDEKASSEDIHSLARGGAINLLGSASQAVFGSGLLLVLARGLGAGGAGAFMEAVAIFNVVSVTSALGVETGFVRSVSRLRVRGRRRELRMVFLVGYVPVMVMSLVTAVAMWFGDDVLADAFGAGDHDAEIANYVRAMAPFVPLGSVMVATLGATRGFETMLPTVMIDRVARLGLQFVAVGVAAWISASSSSVALAWAVPVALAAGGATLWLRSLVRRDRSLADEPLSGVAAVADYSEADPSLIVVAREFWAFTLPRTFASVFRVTVQWLDLLLIGWFLSPRDAGIYAISTRLLQFGLAVALAIGQVSQPMISRLLANDRMAETKSVYETATAWQMLLTWPQYLGISIFAPGLLLIFGPEFVDGTVVVVILAMSMMLGSGAGPVDMVLLMAGRSLWNFWNTAASLVVNIGLNFLLIPRLGIAGAALAWAASRVIDNVVPLVQVNWAFGLHPFGRRWWRAGLGAMIAFGVLGLVARGLGGPGFGVFVVYATVAVLLYAPWLWFRREEFDLSTAVSAIQRRFSRSSARRTRTSS